MQEAQGPVKGMPSDEEILEKLDLHLNQTLTISQNWRQNEVKDNYALFEGNQWLLEAMQRQAANGMPMITINRVAPVIEAICGYEIQNRLDIDYVPRLMNDEQSGFTDVVKNAVKYYDQRTLANLQYSLGFKDMLICGVGCIATSIDYKKNPDGEIQKRRVFPGFMFWDPSARGKNLSDANYVTEIKAVDREILKQEYGIEDISNVYTANMDARIIEFFDSVLAIKQLGIVYEHQWRQSEPFYRIENPFKNINYMDTKLQDIQSLQDLKQQLGKQFNFNPDLDTVFSVLDDKDFNNLKEIFQIANLDMKYTTQQKYKYYRAIVTSGRVIEKSENFHQEGFSVEFMTGQWSELNQNYYGLLRGCKDPQRMLNQTVSDFVGFLQTNPKGGVDVEIDAIKDLDSFLQSYTKARQVTLFNPGGIQKSRPKVSAPLPQGILEMIQYADQQIMQVCGVPPELMGMMQTKEQNSAFFRQQLKQGYTPLATYFDAKYMFLQRQSLLDISCIRVLAENNEGRLIHNVLGEEDAPSMPLLKSNIAADYDIVVEEVPDAPGDRIETFERLIQLQGQLAAMPNPVNIMPLALQYSDLDPKIIKELQKMMMPQAAPPDPLNQALLQSEVQHKQASAQKVKAEALHTTVEAMNKHRELMNAPVKQRLDNDLTAAKTISELSKVKDGKQNAIKERLDQHLETLMHMDNMNLEHKKVNLQHAQHVNQMQQNQDQFQKSLQNNNINDIQ